MHNHGLVAELNERLRKRQGLDGVAQWSVSGCVMLRFWWFPLHPPIRGGGMQVGSLAWTYERAKASAKATDKNKSCTGEIVSLAIGADRSRLGGKDNGDGRAIPFMVNVCEDAELQKRRL